MLWNFMWYECILHNFCGCVRIIFIFFFQCCICFILLLTIYICLKFSALIVFHILLMLADNWNACNLYACNFCGCARKKSPIVLLYCLCYKLNLVWLCFTHFVFSQKLLCIQKNEKQEVIIKIPNIIYSITCTCSSNLLTKCYKQLTLRPHQTD